MAKVNLQIRIDPKIEEDIESLSQEVSKSEFVRLAIIEKIQKERDKRLEQSWIQSLTKNPQRSDEVDAWLLPESWGKK